MESMASFKRGSISIDPAASRKYEVEGGVERVKSATFRSQVEYWLATSRTAMYIDLLNTVLSVAAIALYVAETYYMEAEGTEQTMSNFNATEMIMSVLFALDYLLRFFAAPKKLRYISSYQAIIDLVTIIPGFVSAFDFARSREELNVMSVISLFRILRVLRILRLHRLISFTDSEIVQEIITLFLSLICIVFVCAGVLHLVENIRWLYPAGVEYREVDFFTVIYLIITTITTVGYGDVVPLTIAGKMIIIFMMMSALVLVPRQTNKLIALMAMTSVYGRQRYRYNSHSEHVVVCGAISSGGVIEFFTEFFHPDHGNVESHAVVIGRGLPSMDMQNLLGDPKYAYGLTYLDGNVMNEKDLRRAVAQHAKAVFVLANKFAKNTEEEDASTILRALSLKRFVQREKNGKDIMTCVQLINPESKKLFLSSTQRSRGAANPNHIVCIDEIKMNLLAKSCLCPGMSTMICNLISSGDEDADENAPDWVQEIYRVKLSKSFEGLTFLEAAQVVYDEAQSLLFALELNPPATLRRLVLNPGAFEIPPVDTNGVFGYVIAEDQSEAEVVERISLTRHDTGGVGGGIMGDMMGRMMRNRKVSSIERGIGRRITAMQTNRSTKPGATGGGMTKSTLWTKVKQAAKVSSGGDDIDALNELYYLREWPISLQDATLRSVEDNFSEDWGGHIIVVGNAANLYHFILPLRSKHLAAAIPIVVLHATDPSKSAWQKLAYFQDIYFVKGSALELDDLRRAGIARASRAVIFAKEYDMASGSLEALVDADTIFAYSVLSKENPNIQIVGELVTQSNISFMSDTEKRVNAVSRPSKKDATGVGQGGTGEAQPHYLSPPFAAGYVYTSTMLDTLLCQAFYNPNIIEILQHLVAGEDEAKAKRWNEKMAKTLKRPMIDSHLYQIPVPAKYHRKTYGELFEHLVTSRHMLPLGLRRGIMKKINCGQLGNKMPYVFTNPPKDALVFDVDSVFVLAQGSPSEDRVQDLARNVAPADQLVSPTSPLAAVNPRGNKMAADSVEVSSPAGAISSAATPQVTRTDSSGYGSIDRQLERAQSIRLRRSMSKESADAMGINLPSPSPQKRSFGTSDSASQVLSSLQADFSIKMDELNREMREIVERIAQIEKRV